MTVRLLVTGSRQWANASRLVQYTGLESEVARTLAASMRIEQEAVLTSAVHYLAALRPGEDIVLVHGGASGADVAAGWAWEKVRRNVQATAKTAGVAPVTLLAPEVHVPAWGERGTPSYNPNAGFERNLAMLALGADLVVGFMVQRSKGTEHTLAHAVHQGKTVWMTRTMRCDEGLTRPVRSILTPSTFADAFPSFRGVKSQWDLVTAVDVPATERTTPEFTFAAADDVDPDVPLCRVCGSEAPLGHQASCPISDFRWVKARVFHDRSLGLDRCGECGDTIPEHDPVPCMVQVPPVQRRVPAMA